MVTDTMVEVARARMNDAFHTVAAELCSRLVKAPFSGRCRIDGRTRPMPQPLRLRGDGPDPAGAGLVMPSSTRPRETQAQQVAEE